MAAIDLRVTFTEKINKLCFEYGQPWTFALELRSISKLVGCVSQQQE